MCTVYKEREQTEWNATKLNVICMQNSTDFVSFSLCVCFIVVFFFAACDVVTIWILYLFREPNWFSTIRVRQYSALPYLNFVHFNIRNTELITIEQIKCVHLLHFTKCWKCAHEEIVFWHTILQPTLLYIAFALSFILCLGKILIENCSPMMVIVMVMVMRERAGEINRKFSN